MDQQSKEPTPQGILSRGFTEIRFLDQYGEERVIHRHKGKNLRVKKREDSPCHLLNRAAGELIGKRIKAARIARGLTAEQLLTKAGLTGGGQPRNRMYEIENGGTGATLKNKQGVRVGTLYALAMALDCAPSDLMPSPKEVALKAGVSFVVTDARLSKIA